MKQKIYIVTGKPGSGKTSFLLELASLLRQSGMSITGFAAPSIREEQRSYNILELDSGQSLPLATESQTENWEKHGPFFFNPEALKFGNSLLMNPEISNKDLVIIDEIGHFELKGKIWANAISHVLANHHGVLILVVRETLILEVSRKWSINNPEIIRIDAVSMDQFAADISQAI